MPHLRIVGVVALLMLTIPVYGVLVSADHATVRGDAGINDQLAKAAQEAYRVLLQADRMGQINTMEPACEWSKRWCEAELRANPLPAARRAAAQAHLARMRECETILTKLRQTKTARPTDVPIVRYFRLDAERLVQSQQ